MIEKEEDETYEEEDEDDEDMEDDGNENEDGESFCCNVSCPDSQSGTGQPPR